MKAIGLDLKDAHVKQAVDYAANQGVEWVVLTNGIKWRVYKVIFAKPIDNELVVELNALELNPKSDEHLQLVWLLAKRVGIMPGSTSTKCIDRRSVVSSSALSC